MAKSQGKNGGNGAGNGHVKGRNPSRGKADGRRKPGGNNPKGNGGKTKGTKQDRSASIRIFGPETKVVYLEALRDGAGKMHAAKEVGVSNDLVRLERIKDPVFREQEHEAYMEGRRARNDHVVDNLFHLTSYNASAALAWLYNRMPDVWKDLRALNLTGDFDALLRFFPPELASIFRKYAAQLNNAGGTRIAVREIAGGVESDGGGETADGTRRVGGVDGAVGGETAGGGIQGRAAEVGE